MLVKNRLQYNAYQNAYYHANTEKCAAHGARWSRLNRVKVNAARYISEAKCKERVLTYYGDGVLACLRCGFSDMDCLSIDHINGRGRKHIEEIGGGTFLYHWLENNGLPKGYQTLCMNCNWKKRVTNNECKRGVGNAITSTSIQ